MTRGYSKFVRGIIQSRQRSISGLDLELTPQGVDILLAVVHAHVLHHVVSYCGMSPVGSDHEVKVDFNLSCPAGLSTSPLDLEPGLATAEVGTCQLVIEQETDIGHRCQDVEKPLIQPGAINGKDGL